MYVVKVSGINCDHCIHTITKALEHLDRQADVQIDPDTQTVRFDGNADIEEVLTAIKGEGYGVLEARSK